MGDALRGQARSAVKFNAAQVVARLPTAIVLC